jgi:hypothetical protein
VVLLSSRVSICYRDLDGSCYAVFNGAVYSLRGAAVVADETT